MSTPPNPDDVRRSHWWQRSMAAMQLIELCGGFGPRASAAVLEAVAGRVPVGVVSYAAHEAPALTALFGSEARSV